MIRQAVTVCAREKARRPTLRILLCGITTACCLTSCQSDSSIAIAGAGKSNKMQVAPWHMVVGSEQNVNGILACGDKWFTLPTHLRHFGFPHLQGRWRNVLLLHIVDVDAVGRMSSSSTM
jgi:hypothetical protein